MKLSVNTNGSFKNIEKFFERAAKLNIEQKLKPYAERGVQKLAAATPRDTGLTASSWSYEIRSVFGKTYIYWTNSNLSQGVPVVILIQYGHGTRNGGYVVGQDFINPALQPIFQQIADDMWKEVTK